MRTEKKKPPTVPPYSHSSLKVGDEYMVFRLSEQEIEAKLYPI